MGDRPKSTDDIYAVGATIYELLTGKPHFYSGDITAQVNTKTAPPVSHRRDEFARNVTDTVPKEGDQVIAATLDKDPTRRPQKAGEIASPLGVSVRSELGTSRAQTQPQTSAVPPENTAATKPSLLTKILIAGIVLSLLAVFAIVAASAFWWARPAWLAGGSNRAHRSHCHCRRTRFQNPRHPAATQARNLQGHRDSQGL